MDLGLDVLDKVDKFILERTKRVPSVVVAPPVKVAQGSQVPVATRAESGGSGSKLNNTLPPNKWLSRTMTLEEATTWLKTFESYLVSNMAALDKKSNSDVETHGREGGSDPTPMMWDFRATLRDAGEPFFLCVSGHGVHSDFGA